MHHCTAPWLTRRASERKCNAFTHELVCLLALPACRWGVDTLNQELAEPTQLCKLLLSGRVSAQVLSAWRCCCCSQ